MTPCTATVEHDTSQHIDYSELYAGINVAIVVPIPHGRHTLMVNKWQLLTESRKAARIFQNPVKGAGTKEMVVTGTPLWVCKTFVCWLYYNKILYDAPTDEPWTHYHEDSASVGLVAEPWETYWHGSVPHNATTWHLHSLISLFIFAWRYEVPALVDEIVDVIQVATRQGRALYVPDAAPANRFLATRMVLDLFIKRGETLKYALRKVSRHAKLRTMILDMYAYGEAEGYHRRLNFALGDLQSGSMMYEVKSHRKHVRLALTRPPCCTMSECGENFCIIGGHAYKDLLAPSTRRWCLYHEHDSFGRRRDCTAQYFAAQSMLGADLRDYEMDRSLIRTLKWSDALKDLYEDGRQSGEDGEATDMLDFIDAD